MLVGRDQQQQVLQQALDGAVAGRASTLRLVGEPGVGKTSLLDWAAEQAAALGVQVVRLVALELEQELPAAGLDILLGRLGASEKAPTPSGLLAAIAAASARNPLLLALDDVQWLDAQSLAAVSFATRRLLADPVTVVLAGRPETDRIAALAPIPAVQVPPLTPDQGRQVLLRAVPGVADAVAAEVSASLGGVPLALLEAGRILSADALAGREPLPNPLPVGPAVQDRYARGFAQQEPACRDALVLLAVAATADPAVIQAALQRAGLDIHALEPAEDGGLVQLQPAPRFIHPLARAAVHSAALPRQLRTANRVLADTLTERGDAPAALRHRAACATPPDPGVAAQLEELALTMAAVPASRTEAGQVALLAARFASDPADRNRLRVLATECAAREQSLLLVEQLQGEDLPADLRARITFVKADLGGFDHPDDASAALASLQDLPLTAPVRQRLNARRVDLAADRLMIDEVRALALQVEQGCRGEGSWLDLMTAGMAFTFVGDHARAVPLLRRARDITAGLDIGDLGRNELLTWVRIPIWLGEPDAEHAERTRRFDAVLRARGQPDDLSTAAFRSAERAHHEGRWDRAVALYHESLEITALSGRTDVAGAAQLACLLAYRGEEVEVGARIESANEVLDMWSPWLAGLLTRARGALALTLGRHEEAVSLLRPVREVRFVGRGVRDWVAESLVDLVEASVATGDRAAAAMAAEDLADRLEGVADPLGPALVARCRALVAPHPDEADELLAVALGHHDEVEAAFDRARTLLVRGELLRRSRRPRQARDPLADALATFQRLRAPHWARRAQRELAASGHRIDRATAKGSADLTPQETRVAIAVADGLTNAEVAQQLFLSVKTVEFHLGRVYRKLDVRSRGGLARALGSRGL